MKAAETAVSLGAGLLGGFVGNALLGLLFTRRFVNGILYDPTRQSALFLSVTPQRNVALSVIGLIVLSSLHGWLFARVRKTLPEWTWWAKGCVFGTWIWMIFWLPQEWFVYVTLLGEPVSLASFELVLLLGGSIVEGIVIATVVEKWHTRAFVSKAHRCP